MFGFGIGNSEREEGLGDEVAYIARRVRLEAIYPRECLGGLCTCFAKEDLFSENLVYNYSSI